jgi:hypothetical protein
MAHLSTLNNSLKKKTANQQNLYEVRCIQKVKIYIAMVIRSTIQIPYDPTDLWPSQPFQARKNKNVIFT